MVTLALPSRVTSSSANSNPLPPVLPTSSSLIGSTVDVVLVRERAKASNVMVLLSTLTLHLSPHLLPQPPIKSYTLGCQALQSEQSQRLLPQRSPLVSIPQSRKLAPSLNGWMYLLQSR